MNETLPALRLLQQQGKARFVGITGYWPSLLADFARMVPGRHGAELLSLEPFDGRYGSDLTPLTEQIGIGLLNASPLHMGLLGGGTVPEWHPAPVQVREAAKDFARLCQQHGVNAATVALHHCLKHASVASTFVGFQSTAEVGDALQALEFTPSPDLTQAIGKLVGRAFNINWRSGLLENQPAEQTHAH